MKVLNMKKVDEALSEVLDMEPIPQQEKLVPAQQEKLVPAHEETLTNDAQDDYNLARKTMRELIEKGSMAMEDMQELARQSESPRAYEVYATLMKTISETTKDLYDLQKKTKELKEVRGKPTQPDGAITVEKAVFVGSTADLLKKIKEN